MNHEKNEGVVKGLLGAVATAAVPPLVLRGLWNKEWRESLPDRLARGAWDKWTVPSDVPIWFHGASVGEVGGLSPVISALKSEYPEIPVVVTTTSETGKDSALRQKLTKDAFILPFDHPWFINRIVSKVSPRLFVLTETELWPHLIGALSARSVPLVLINGRISKYSFNSYKRMRRVVAPMLSRFEALMVQTEGDAERYLELGAPLDRLFVVGSTKYAKQLSNEGPLNKAQIISEFGLNPDFPCFVAGSVRPGEEEQVIQAYKLARRQLPGLQMIFAPRHPQRYVPVTQMLTAAGLSFQRRSAGTGVKAYAPVVMLDTMGELSRAYGAGCCGFVGGTLVDIGGHNPLEPAQHRVPVIVGPHVSNVQDAIEELSAVNGVTIVNNTEQLAERIITFSRDSELNKKLGDAAYEVWEHNSTTLARVLPVIREFV